MRIITMFEKILYLILFISVVLWYFFDFFSYFKMFSGIMLAIILLFECNFPYKKFGFPYIKDWSSTKNFVIANMYGTSVFIIWELVIISFTKHSQFGYVVFGIFFLIGMWISLGSVYFFKRLFKIGQAKYLLNFFYRQRLLRVRTHTIIISLLLILSLIPSLVLEYI